jgi:acetyltransferase
MSIRNLDKMFRPQSIAVIGASDKPQSVGSSVMQNVLAAGFGGQVFPVNPNTTEVHGIPA